MAANTDGTANISNDAKKDGNLTLESFRVESGKREKERNPALLKSLTEVSHKFEAEHVIKSTLKLWHAYPVYRQRENEIFALGNSKAHVLAKISTVRTEPSASAKKSFLNSKTSNQSSTIYSQTNLDKFWNKRYYLFEKFDEGIKINEESWPMIIPEAVSDYVSSKIKCPVVLDAFCGVGGNSLKLVNTCQKVIAADSNEESLKCLYNNTQISSTENIEIIHTFLDAPLNCEPDVILISNYTKIEENLKEKSISVTDFNPSLKNVFIQAFKNCKNIAIVLPGNIDVEELGSLFATVIMELNIVSETCSLKIEKIFFADRLKFLAVFFGELVNKDVIINEELAWIYKYLNSNVNKVFSHKKLVKKVRSTFGMIKLLNLVLESSLIEGDQSIFDKFCVHLKQNNIIPESELLKLLGEKELEKNKPNANEEQPPEKPILEENESESSKEDLEIERTNSFFSSIVGEPNNNHDTRLSISHNKEIEIEIVDGSQCQSTSIFGQRSTYTPKSANFTSFPYPPGRSSVGMKKVEEECNRDSDVVEFMELNIK